MAKPPPTVGLERMVSDTGRVGRVLAGREQLAKDTTRLVGLNPLSRRYPGCGAFGALDQPADAAHDLGYINSVVTTALPIDDRLIPKDAEDYTGGRAVSLLDQLDIEVQIVSPHFVDPEGERLRV